MRDLGTVKEFMEILILIFAGAGVGFVVAKSEEFLFSDMVFGSLGAVIGFYSQASRVVANSGQERFFIALAISVLTIYIARSLQNLKKIA